MGNKDSKIIIRNGSQEPLGPSDGDPIQLSRSNSIISTQSQDPEIRSHVLPPLAFQRVRNCLLKLPVEEGQEIKEKAIDRVAQHVVVKEYGPGQDVILKGDNAKGIFVIVEGRVKVLSAKGNEVFANLHEGDFFGEISVLFNTQCTARIQTDTSCVLAHLELGPARRLLHKVDIDIIDWFVARRYLPTMDHLDVERTLRRMTYTSLKACPIFSMWGEEALRSLILHIDPAMIVLYQPNVVIVCDKDPPVAIHVIIRGSAVIKDRRDRTLVNIEVGNQADDPVVIGEEGMYLGYNNRVMIQTVRCCEIIQIREEWIENAVNKYPEDAGKHWNARKMKWRALLEKKDEIYQKYSSALQFEVVFQLLKNSKTLSLCSSHCVQHIALQGIPQEFQANDVVCIQDEMEDGILVLALVGDLELVTDPDMRYAFTVDEGEVFYPSDWMGNNSKLVARSDCVAFKIDQSVVEEALNTYPDSQIILPTQPL